MDYFEESIDLHRRYKGKIRTSPKMNIKTRKDLSLVYSPGVAGPSKAIFENPDEVWELTIKSNTVAIVSDGTAVLGLGDIGPHAAIPVMEGKAMLFKKFAGIDAFPICLDTKDPDKIIETCRIIAPVFGGINLEDISAPRSFQIEKELQNLGIPVFHDDQHGTAIVVLAALINAAQVVGKKLSDLKVVVNGAGAAGIAIARLLYCQDTHSHDRDCVHVGEIILCDSKGILHSGREDLNEAKKKVLEFTNKRNMSGTVKDALVDADVFIGVSIADLLKASDIESMADDAIVLALANPIPEIMPDEAIKGGAKIVGTGRSDLPNQVNNVLGFPGIFRGAIDARAKRITPKMKLAAAYAIADCIRYPNIDHIIPSTLNMDVATKVAEAVQEAWDKENPG